MTVEVLSAEETRQSGFTHKFTITATADFAATDTGATKTIAIFPATGNSLIGVACQAAAMKLNTAFDSTDDATIDSLLVEVGDGSDPNRLLDQTEIAGDNTEINYAITLNSVDTMPYVYLAVDTIDAKFTVAGGGTPTIAELDSGSVSIYLNLIDLDGI